MKSQFPGDDSIWIQVVSWLCYLAFLKFAPKMLSISNFKIQKGNLKWEILFIHKNGSGLGLSKILFNDFIPIKVSDFKLHLERQVMPIPAQRVFLHLFSDCKGITCVLI